MLPLWRRRQRTTFLQMFLMARCTRGIQFSLLSQIILYLDVFSVMNPLDSAKRKHKILAICMTLADIFPHNRSNVDHMPPVLLCGRPIQNL